MSNGIPNINTEVFLSFIFQSSLSAMTSLGVKICVLLSEVQNSWSAWLPIIMFSVLKHCITWFCLFVQKSSNERKISRKLVAEKISTISHLCSWLRHNEKNSKLISPIIKILVCRYHYKLEKEILNVLHFFIHTKAPRKNTIF